MCVSLIDTPLVVLCVFLGALFILLHHFRGQKINFFYTSKNKYILKLEFVFTFIYVLKLIACESNMTTKREEATEPRAELCIQ